MTQPAVDRHRQMAMTAMILGVVGVVFGIQIFGILFSGLAIVFAILSRGSRHEWEKMAKAAIALGITGCVISIAMTVMIVVTTIRFLPQLIHTQEFRQTAEQMYGEDADAIIANFEALYLDGDVAE